MSTYDLIAFGDRPSLYLSAPETTDKSGASTYPLVNNTLSPTGQPIIFGSEYSFNVTSSAKTDVTGNPLFFNSAATMECVLIAARPTEAVPIVIDSDGLNAVQITSDGITLKLFFENALSTYSKVATVPIYDWNVKMYISVSISDTQASLTVNGKTAVLSYSDEIVSSTNVTIGGGYSGYHYLLDGIGFYTKTYSDKAHLINDPMSGYSSYASRRHAGVTTRFEGYQSNGKTSYGLSEFTYSNTIDGEQYSLGYVVNQIQDGTAYIIVRTNDERITVSYDLDFDDSGEFTEYLLVGAVNQVNVRFVVNAQEVSDDFVITIETIYDPDIVTQTPAELELVGLALYSSPNESIVNFPDGVKLPEATYTGTWIENIPESIEIVFKPVESSNDTVVYASVDGQVSFGPTGSITGFTAYLNGALVTDLTDIRYDQWNHLVLTDASPTATEFYLNSDDGISSTETISYMLLTAYPTVLDADAVDELYRIISGIDILTNSETIVITEGSFVGGQAFNAYSYAWAIVGAGGS